jgi:hypothetical protein
MELMGEERSPLKEKRGFKRNVPTKEYVFNSRCWLLCVGNVCGLKFHKAKRISDLYLSDILFQINHEKALLGI